MTIKINQFINSLEKLKFIVRQESYSFVSGNKLKLTYEYQSEEYSVKGKSWKTQSIGDSNQTSVSKARLIVDLNKELGLDFKIKKRSLISNLFSKDSYKIVNRGSPLSEELQIALKILSEQTKCNISGKGHRICFLFSDFVFDITTVMNEVSIIDEKI